MIEVKAEYKWVNDFDLNQVVKGQKDGQTKYEVFLKKGNNRVCFEAIKNDSSSYQIKMVESIYSEKYTRAKL